MITIMDRLPPELRVTAQEMQAGLDLRTYARGAKSVELQLDQVRRICTRHGFQSLDAFLGALRSEVTSLKEGKR